MRIDQGIHISDILKMMGLFHVLAFLLVLACRNLHIRPSSLSLPALYTETAVPSAPLSPEDVDFAVGIASITIPLDQFSFKFYRELFSFQDRHFMLLLESYTKSKWFHSVADLLSYLHASGSIKQDALFRTAWARISLLEGIQIVDRLFARNEMKTLEALVKATSGMRTDPLMVLILSHVHVPVVAQLVHQINSVEDFCTDTLPSVMTLDEAVVKSVDAEVLFERFRGLTRRFESHLTHATAQALITEAAIRFMIIDELPGLLDEFFMNYAKDAAYVHESFGAFSELALSHGNGLAQALIESRLGAFVKISSILNDQNQVIKHFSSLRDIGQYQTIFEHLQLALQVTHGLEVLLAYAIFNGSSPNVVQTIFDTFIQNEQGEQVILRLFTMDPTRLQIILASLYLSTASVELLIKVALCFPNIDTVYLLLIEAIFVDKPTPEQKTARGQRVAFFADYFTDGSPTVGNVILRGSAIMQYGQPDDLEAFLYSIVPSASVEGLELTLETLIAGAEEVNNTVALSTISKWTASYKIPKVKIYLVK